MVMSNETNGLKSTNYLKFDVDIFSVADIEYMCK